MVPDTQKTGFLELDFLSVRKSVTSTHIYSKSITFKGVTLQKLKTSLKSKNLAYSGNEDCIHIVLDPEKVERSMTEYR